MQKGQRVVPVLSIGTQIFNGETGYWFISAINSFVAQFDIVESNGRAIRLGIIPSQREASGIGSGASQTGNCRWRGSKGSE